MLSCDNINAASMQTIIYTLAGKDITGSGYHRWFFFMVYYYGESLRQLYFELSMETYCFLLVVKKEMDGDYILLSKRELQY